MYKIVTIKRLLAGVLLILFTLSVTPKILIHALVAHHQDVHLSFAPNSGDQINKAGFHCNVENLVVEVPFLFYPVSIQLVVPQQFRVYQTGAGHQYYSFNHFIFGLRGPPAVA